MVTSFEDIPRRAFTSVVIQEAGGDRPSAEKLERIDEAVAGFRGFAWRFGLGSNRPTMNAYEYGYLLPKGGYIDQHNLADLREAVEEAGVDDPWVRTKSIWVDGEEIDSMELIGTPPEEALSGLAEFASDFRDEYGGE